MSYYFQLAFLRCGVFIFQHASMSHGDRLSIIPLDKEIRDENPRNRARINLYQPGKYYLVSMPASDNDKQYVVMS